MKKPRKKGRTLHKHRCVGCGCTFRSEKRTQEYCVPICWKKNNSKRITPVLYKY